MGRFVVRGVVAAVVAVGLAVVAAPAATGDPADTIDATLDGLQGDAGERAITFVGTVRDRRDLTGLGAEGSWFPLFGASPGSDVSGAPTGEGAIDRLPVWVTAFNHTSSPADPGCTDEGALERGCMPTYNFRTFSQDGPAGAAGGFDSWSPVRTPTGECGLAGAIVDPQTYIGDQEYDDPTGLVFPRDTENPKPNNNNTINRIQLTDGTPASFHVSVLVDTTGGDHDPGWLEIRGNVGTLDVPSQVADSQVDADEESLASIDLSANGVPDLLVFRVDNFVAGDYLKLRLRGADAPASFSGLLFDVSPPSSRPEGAPGNGDGDADGIRKQQNEAVLGCVG